MHRNIFEQALTVELLQSFTSWLKDNPTVYVSERTEKVEDANGSKVGTKITYAAWKVAAIYPRNVLIERTGNRGLTIRRSISTAELFVEQTNYLKYQKER